MRWTLLHSATASPSSFATFLILKHNGCGLRAMGNPETASGEASTSTLNQIGHQRSGVMVSTFDWIQSASDDPHDPLLGSRLACLGCELNT